MGSIYCTYQVFSWALLTVGQVLFISKHFVSFIFYLDELRFTPQSKFANG